MALLAVALATADTRLLDVAEQVGLTDVFVCGGDRRKDYIIETLGGGVAVLDYDNDGLRDVFFVSGSRLDDPAEEGSFGSELYRNKGDGTFEKTTRAARLEQSGWGQGVCVGDFDNNGWDDVFVTYWGRNRLYRNTGGRFDNVAKAAGLADDERWSTGCAFFDYDRDGLLDLFVANYVVFDTEKIPKAGESPECVWKGRRVMCGPKGLAAETNQLFRNLGGGRFEDVSKSSGIVAAGPRYSLSVTTLDYNSDQLPDVYVAADSQASQLFENLGDGTFEDVGLIAGVAFSDDGRSQAGMGTAAADFDGDLLPDLVKTNFIEDTTNLYRNQGDGSFEDAIARYGLGRNTMYLGWGVVFFDYDNDSWPDLFLVNGHVYPEIEAVAPDSPYRQRRLLYRNLGGKAFKDVSAEVGGGVVDPHSGRGLAAADFEGDGDVDLFINNMNERPSLLRNDGEGKGTYIQIDLEGRRSNRNGIGAVVTVRAGGREMRQEVRSGSSFMSHNDLRLHFGLGEAAKVDEIRVSWPFEGSEDVVRDVAANRVIVIVEGEGVRER